MKKIFIAFSILVFVCASCTKKYVPAPDPEIKDQGTTVVKVAIVDMAIQQAWTAGTKLGVYDTNGHENYRYTLKSEYIGQTGMAEFYGQGVAGSLMAYIPYNEYGYLGVKDYRQPIAEIQDYYTSAEAHMVGNSILVAKANEHNEFTFSYNTAPIGLLHFKVVADVTEKVKSVIINCPYAPLAGNVAIDETSVGTDYVTNPVYSVGVTGMDNECTAANPLEFWLLVPAGSFKGLSLALTTPNRIIPIPVSGEYSVEKSQECLIQVGITDNTGSTSDFEAIDDVFDK